MAGAVHVYASVLGKGEAKHHVWVDSTSAFGAAILDLVGNGVTVCLSSSEQPEDKCISVGEVLQAFGYLKYKAKGGG